MVTGLLNCFQGAVPVAISSVVQPRLQISALRQEMPPPSSRITSGAIQEGVPAGEVAMSRMSGHTFALDIQHSVNRLTTPPPGTQLLPHSPLMSPLEL
jgi:hypothetical protein